MAVVRKKDAHIWERDEYDWYVEPSECSAALFASEDFSGRVWDPACGIGRIVKSAREAGLSAVGTDIVKRDPICEAEIDFLRHDAIVGFDHIVSNPPFGCAETFIQKAINTVPLGGKVAMLLPLVWLTGFSSKRDWLPESPLKTLMPISPRPSMPPGAVVVSGQKVGNGTKDFAWFVWQRGYSEGCKVHFLNTNRWKSGKRARTNTVGMHSCGLPIVEYR
jgi:hypothetical protein